MPVSKHERGKRSEFTVRFLEPVKATDKEERYTDARTPGLTLAVKPSKRKKEGSKLWRFRYMANGKTQMISPGAFPVVSLKEARDKAHEAGKKLSQGLDPSEERQIEKQSASERSFRAISEMWFADKLEHKWKKTCGSQNHSRFLRYIYPALGDKEINEVTLADFDASVQHQHGKRPAAPREKLFRKRGPALNGNKNHELCGSAMPYYDRDLIEMQLAHTEKDKVRESYNRRDPYSRREERRGMMQAYADYLDHLRQQHSAKLILSI